MLKFSDVTKTFGETAALQDVSFEVDDGEFLFLVGPSGAGKTTLIRLIMRDLLPDSGEIFLEDQDITKIKVKEVPKLRRKVGVVFQDFKVISERTVYENVEIALAVIGLPRDEWESRVNHVLELVGLPDKSKLFPRQLSGGELQRVSLARALVVNPKLIIADEPTGNLDWETADKLMDLFKKINEEGKTIIMATHHKLIIDKYPGRIVKIEGGKVVDDSGGRHKSKKKVEDDGESEDEKEEEKKKHGKK